MKKIVTLAAVAALTTLAACSGKAPEAASTDAATSAASDAASDAATAAATDVAGGKTDRDTSVEAK